MYYYTIKKIIRMLAAATLTLALSACSVQGKLDIQPTDTTSPMISFENGESGKVFSLPSEEAAPCFDLIGPWHLDEKENDSDYLAETFPGYGEWGASMEIRSNGQIGWYIGAEGWNGTYELEDNGLRADMTASLDETENTWFFQLVDGSGNTLLKMDYKGTVLVWKYGDQPDSPAGEGAVG